MNEDELVQVYDKAGCPSDKQHLDHRAGLRAVFDLGKVQGGQAIYMATIETPGEDEHVLGLFLSPESAHKAVTTQCPRGSAPEWELDGASDRVTRYVLKTSAWWVGRVIKYEVQP